MSDITRYLSLITSEHSDKPRFRALLTRVLEKIDLSVNIDNSFDLDTASGVQLDIIGLLLGLSRTLTFQPLGGISPLLSDTDYRSLLRAKIILNYWDGTLENLALAINSWNPYVNFSIKDNQDMSLEVAIVGATPMQQALIENGYVIPKPAGVSINYIASDTVIFSYDSDTPMLSGYGTGNWAYSSDSIYFTSWPEMDGDIIWDDALIWKEV